MNLLELAKMARRWPPETSAIIGKDYGSETPVAPWYNVAAHFVCNVAMTIRDAINVQLNRAEDKAEALCTLKVCALLLVILAAVSFVIPWAMERHVEIEIQRSIVEESRRSGQ